MDKLCDWLTGKQCLFWLDYFFDRILTELILVYNKKTQMQRFISLIVKVVNSSMKICHIPKTYMYKVRWKLFKYRKFHQFLSTELVDVINFLTTLQKLTLTFILS